MIETGLIDQWLIEEILVAYNNLIFYHGSEDTDQPIQSNYYEIHENKHTITKEK